MQHKLRWWQKSPCHRHWWWFTTCFLARWLLQFVLMETERSTLELHFFSVPYLVLVPNLRWMDESSTRKLFIPSMLNRVRVILNIANFHFDFFIFQEFPLDFPWTLLFSPSSRLFSFPYHPLSLVLELTTQPSPLSLAHGQKPWHCLLHPAGRWSPPSQPSSVIYFHLVQRHPTMSVDPYDIVIVEEKGNICKVAMLISTKPPLIPGINQCCL